MPSAEDADRPGDHPALDALRELPPTSLFVFDAALDLQRYHAAAPHHVLGEVAGEPVEDGSAGLLDEEVFTPAAQGAGGGPDADPGGGQPRDVR